MRFSIRLPPWPTSTLLIISLSLSATILSQPQNLEVFFPSTPPPLNPPTSQSSYNIKRAVAVAVGVTAVTTLIIVALILLIISRCRNKRRVRVKQSRFSEHVVNNTAKNNISEPTTTTATAAIHGGGTDEATAVVGSGVYRFGKFEGNLKGLIVDENGLDVVYWRKLEGLSSKNSFKKEVFKKADDADDKQLRLSRKISRRKETVQEIPLLRGKSSTSHIPLSPDSDEIGQFSPLAKLESFEIERQESITIRSPPHPPSPPHVITSVPKNHTPDLPPKSKNAPPPPPPAKSTMKPPSVLPAKTEDAGSSSSSSSDVKMKPLRSVKIDKGSYRFDGDMMEALFGYVATNRKSPRSDS